MNVRPLILLFVLLAACSPLPAEEPRIAVASNFRNVARELAARFEEQTGQSVQLIFGSSGKHYAQIRQGAPFAAFLSADAERPGKLDQEGRIVPGSRFTYALGQLTLWSKDADRIDGGIDDGIAVLRAGDFRHLAIANPRLAPYGQAAVDVLTHLELMDELRPRLVRGENIEQTFQFVITGNAELGFVARSQLAQSVWGGNGSRWDVPAELHTPIDQQAVLLKDDATARAFLEFLRSDTGRAIIEAHGYGLP